MMQQAGQYPIQPALRTNPVINAETGIDESMNWERLL